MRIIFMGGRDLAIDILDYLIRRKENILCVFCNPNELGGKHRYYKSLKKLARKNKLSVFETKSLKCKKYIDLISSLRPKVIFSVFYGNIIPPEILKIPSLGCINLHGGLLPQYRGCFPGVWSIINGEQYAGLTMHFMDKGIDTGDIISRKQVKIDITDTGRSLYDKLTKEGLALFKETFDRIVEGKLGRIKQDHGRAHYYPRRKPEDNKINWNMDNLKIYNFVRGIIFPPYPGPYTFLNGKKIEISQIKLGRGNIERGKPGEIVGIRKNNVIVGTENGTLCIQKINFKGKIIKAADYEEFKLGKRFDD